MPASITGLSLLSPAAVDIEEAENMPAAAEAWTEGEETVLSQPWAALFPVFPPAAEGMRLENEIAFAAAAQQFAAAGDLPVGLPGAEGAATVLSPEVKAAFALENDDIYSVPPRRGETARPAVKTEIPVNVHFYGDIRETADVGVIIEEIRQKLAREFSAGTDLTYPM